MHARRRGKPFRVLANDDGDVVLVLVEWQSRVVELNGRRSLCCFVAEGCRLLRVLFFLAFVFAVRHQRCEGLLVFLCLLVFVLCFRIGFLLLLLANHQMPDVGNGLVAEIEEVE